MLFLRQSRFPLQVHSPVLRNHRRPLPRIKANRHPRRSFHLFSKKASKRHPGRLFVSNCMVSWRIFLLRNLFAQNHMTDNPTATGEDITAAWGAIGAEKQKVCMLSESYTFSAQQSHSVDMDKTLEEGETGVCFYANCNFISLILHAYFSANRRVLRKLWRYRKIKT